MKEENQIRSISLTLNEMYKNDSNYLMFVNYIDGTEDYCEYLSSSKTIVKGLIRKKSNELEYPDWSRNGDHHDYKLMRLNEALFKNPSPLVSMAYGDLRRQLISPDFYTKDQAFHMDALFVPQLSKYL